MGKRAFDIVFSILAIIVALPLGAIVAVFLWLMQGTVIFRQVRPGLHGKPFVLFKFCSMTNARNDRGELLPDRLRLTRAGKLLRSLSLDELPQFWNVLRGDMSLVGPRPERPYFTEQLARLIPRYDERTHVRPGITGWAQVRCPYGASVEDARTKLAYDLHYLAHRSLLFDLRILAETVRIVIWRIGAR